MKLKQQAKNRYAAIIESIFNRRYDAGATEILFHRDEMASTAKRLRIELPKNIGDAIYSVRYRMPMPISIVATQPVGRQWVIEGRGKSQYAFRLVAVSRISPTAALQTIKIPDATPEVVSAYALSDEQALLAKVRYNRLLDLFLGVAAYSLQNHLRTTVAGMGQVEIDEVYAGIDKRGRQYIIPVQAKGGSDRLSAVQTRQDMACCAEKFPQLLCRAVSAQFMKEDIIALFELSGTSGDIEIVEERHYKLVPADQISVEDLHTYDR